MNIELTTEQIAAIQARYNKQKEYRKQYYETHKEQVKLYHKRYNAKQRAITNMLKEQGLIQ